MPPPPHFLTRMKILKNRRNSAKLPRKLHGLKHINKTFKMHQDFYCGRGHPSHTLPNLCTETFGFNHSSHYKPSYSTFKKLSFWHISPIRYYNQGYGRPPYVLGPISLRLAVADLAGAHAPYFSHNLEEQNSS